MPATATGRRHAVALPVLLVTTVLAALAMTVAASLLAALPANASLQHQSHRSARDLKIHHGLEVAIRHKGDPYSYGSAGPYAFDCSGLTMFSYDKAGLHLPRTSGGQAQAVRHIPKRNLHRGDLVFFTSGGHVYHVAIYLGHHGGRRWILHAPHSGTVVQRDPIWTRSWFAGTLRHRR
jgi:cell wall-associated NlpC family hydrolase